MRGNPRLVAAAASAVLMSVAVAPPAGAHHGWSEYQDAQSELTGTLVGAVSLAGSHGTAEIRVEEQVWDLVFAPATRTARAGLEEGVIPVGDQVTASGHRHRDAQTLEMKVERLRWNDTVFDVYPGRD